LDKALGSLPVDIKYVFVILHHPVVKRAEDHFDAPEKWDFVNIKNSSLIEYATMPNRLIESRELVRVLRNAARTNQERVIHLAFGHRHKLFLGKIDQPKGERGWFGFRKHLLHTNKTAVLGLVTTNQVVWISIGIG